MVALSLSLSSHSNGRPSSSLLLSLQLGILGSSRRLTFRLMPCMRLGGALHGLHELLFEDGERVVERQVFEMEVLECRAHLPVEHVQME